MVFLSPGGGPSRCYYYWMDFLKCIQEEGSEQPTACKPYADDYMECLHHRKYYERKLAIEREKQKQHAQAEAHPAHH